LTRLVGDGPAGRRAPDRLRDTPIKVTSDPEV